MTDSSSNEKGKVNRAKTVVFGSVRRFIGGTRLRLLGSKRQKPKSIIAWACCAMAVGSLPFRFVSVDGEQKAGLDSWAAVFVIALVAALAWSAQELSSPNGDRRAGRRVVALAAASELALLSALAHVSAQLGASPKTDPPPGYSLGPAAVVALIALAAVGAVAASDWLDVDRESEPGDA